MIILLGSESIQKMDILREALYGLGIEKPEIIPVAADSCITHQPLELETTVRGSFNRAVNAASSYGRYYDLSFGMEGGLEMEKGVYHLVCAVTIVDQEGKRTTGVSEPLPLPVDISGRVLAGEQFSQALRDYLDDQGLGVQEKRAAMELLSRKESFIEATRRAWESIHV